jgi:UDP-N-acetylglucosamine:LPS N-acetylglucosamine transferase
MALTPKHHKLLAFSSNTGGGHRSASLALAEAFSYAEPPHSATLLTHNILEDSIWSNRKLVGIYNNLLRHNQAAMSLYFKAIDCFRPDLNPLFFEAMLPYMRRLFEETTPEALISVHPMTQALYPYIEKKLDRPFQALPLYTVVTDPCRGFWRGWACQQVERYFAPTPEAAEQLTAFGIASHRIEVAGMPVREAFKPVSTSEQHQLQARLGLEQGRFTLLVNAGWVGGGNIPALFKGLLDSAVLQGWGQLIFLTGHNAKLKAWAKAYTAQVQPAYPVLVLDGHQATMPVLMQTADAMLSKLGGLSTFEAMACHLPLLADVLSRPMPQERGTAHYVERHGTGVLVSSLEALVSTLTQWRQQPECLQAIRLACQETFLMGASRRIAHRLAKDLGWLAPQASSSQPLLQEGLAIGWQESLLPV